MCSSDLVLSDILGDPLDMIASGPAVPDTSTCAQALAIAEKYHLNLSEQAKTLLQQETPKALDNVTTRITGSVRELCTAAANACRELGYREVEISYNINVNELESVSLSFEEFISLYRQLGSFLN